MDLYWGQLATICLSIFVLLLLRFYWNFKKKYGDFPYFHFLPFVLNSLFSGKVTKEKPLNSVLLQEAFDIVQKYREGLLLSFVTRPVLFVFGEDAIKKFVNERAAVDKPPEMSLLKYRIGDGIVTRNGMRWRSHRRIINPVFHMNVIKDKIPLFNEHAMNLIKDLEKLSEKPSVDLLDVLRCHYFNSLSESVFGIKHSEENKAEVLKFAKSVDRMGIVFAQSLYFPWLRWKFLLRLLPTGRQFFQDVKETDEYVTKVVSEMKNYLSSKETADKEFFSSYLHKSFTYLLLNQHFNDPTFTLEDVHAETKTILIAGYNNVALSTMWCLFLLGLHPEIQEKVHDEILSVTSDCVTNDQSTNLVYLEAVILESQRIYSTIPVFARNLSEDVVYGKYTVPKGTTITFVPYILHKDPKIYPDPENFQPERFLNPETKRSTNFIPFAEGSRNCIGKYYALLELKIFLAHILRNFKFTSLVKREDIDVCFAVTLLPTKPVLMKVTLRRNNPL